MPLLALPDVIVVLGLLILGIFLLVQVAPQLQQTLNALPGPLSQLGNWAGSQINSLANWYRNWMTGLAGNFAGVINTWIDRIVAVLGEITHTLANTITQANAAPSQAVDTVQQTVVPALQQDIGTAVAYTTSVQQALDTEAQALAGQIEDNHLETQHWVDNLSQNVGAFNSWTISQLQDHSATEQAIESEARSWVDNLSTNVQAFNTWTVGQLQAQAASIGQVNAAAVQRSGIVEAASQTYTQAAVAASSQSLVSWVTQGVGADLQTLTNAYNAYQQDCGNTMCEGMLPSAKGLKTLAELAGGVELIGLVVAMITDPSGTASAIESVIGPLAQDAINGVKAIAGL